VGLGIVLDHTGEPPLEPKTLWVDKVMQGGPASVCEPPILMGDLIIKIDGRLTSKMGSDEMAALLQSKKPIALQVGVALSVSGVLPSQV
jgi:C-terminal processing protease CtpA/Prc